METYAFIDPGSSGTFCTDALVKQLNLHGKGTEIVLSTINSPKRVKGCLVRNLEVCGIDEDKYVTLSKVFVHKRIPVGKKNILHQNDINRWSYLRDVKLPHIDADVELLIGNETPEVFEPWRVIHSRNNGPYAVKTILGWTVNGPIRAHMEGEQRAVTVNWITVENIEKMLLQQYSVDFPEHSRDEKM